MMNEHASLDSGGERRPPAAPTVAFRFSERHNRSMSTKPRKCAQSEIQHVRKFVAYAKLRVNAARYYPPNSAPRYLLALALYSKSITVAEATMALIDAGFSDEAFGMTRTLIDIFFTLHYISNKDTEERALRYAQFTFKNRGSLERGRQNLLATTGTPSGRPHQEDRFHFSLSASVVGQDSEGPGLLKHLVRRHK